MLKNTFQHINKLGYKTEEKIWEEKIYNWDDYYYNIPSFLSVEKGQKIFEELKLSEIELKNKNPIFFTQNLKRME
jgi:hypothetical protein